MKVVLVVVVLDVVLVTAFTRVLVGFSCDYEDGMVLIVMVQKC